MTLGIDSVEDTRQRVTATFTPLGSTTPADPSTVTFSVRTPAGVVTTYTFGVDAALVRVVAGVYYLDVIPSTKGRWWVQARGLGATGINAKYEVFINTIDSVIP